MPVGLSARLPATAKDGREKQRYLNVPEAPDVPRPQSRKRTVRASSVAPAKEEASLREEEGRAALGYEPSHTSVSARR